MRLKNKVWTKVEENVFLESIVKINIKSQDKVWNINLDNLCTWFKEEILTYMLYYF